MSWATCIEAIAKAAGKETLGASERKMIEERVKGIRLALQRAERAGQDPDKALQAILKAERETAASEVAARKRAAAISYMRRERQGDARRTTWADSYTDWLRSLAEGTNLDRPGARNSLATLTWSLRDAFRSKFYSDVVADTDVKAAATSGALDAEVFEYLWARDHGQPTTKFSATAKAYGELISKHQRRARALRNQAGQAIGEELGYATRRVHDMWAVKNAGLRRWTETIQQHFDMDKSFPGLTPAQIAAELEKDYKGFVTGVHDGFTHIKNRTYVSKSGADDYAYFKEFGGGRTLFLSVMGDMEHAGRDIAIMNLVGPGGRNSLQTMIDDARKELEARPGDNTAELREYDKYSRFVMTRLWPSIAQDTPFTGSYALAHFSVGMQNLFRASAAGRTLWSSLGDTNNAASIRNFYSSRQVLNGLAEYLETWSAAGETLATGIGRDKARAMALMHVMGEGLFHYAVDAQAPMMGFAGWTGRLSHAAFQLPLASRMWNGIRYGMALATGKDFGSDVGKTFAELSVGQQAALRHMDISSAEWDVIRRAPVAKVGDHDIMSPATIEEADPELFRALAPNASEAKLKRVRNELAAKFGNMVHSLAEDAVTSPSRVANAAYIDPAARGTWAGAAQSHFLIFRSFMNTMLTRHAAREVMGYHPDRVSLPQALVRIFTNPAAGQLAGVAGMFGFATMWALVNRRVVAPLATGKTPRAPSSLAEAGAWMAEALIASGAFGLTGDLVSQGLQGLFNPGQSASDTVGRSLGLSFKHASDLYKTGQDIVQIPFAEDQEAATAKAMKDGWKTLYDMVPFQNLWYTQWATDYLFRNSVNEMIDPDYLEKMQAKAEESEMPYYATPHALVER